MFEDGEGLPAELAERFELLSVLKHSEGAETCLVKDRESGEKALLKIAFESGEAAQLRNERQILEAIHGKDHDPEAQSFPEVIAYGQDPSEWLARTWVEGHTVEALVESQTKVPGISRNQALDCAISVTEKLVFLHGLKPPIIHRDVKPQNVVMDTEGKYHLIDLGISRVFREGNRLDTQVSGTRATAPPEQYGFRQTDERSDIYSVGVLLRYAMTGEYTEEADQQLPRDVRGIVEKAAKFDPDQRYQRAEELLSALVEVRFGHAARPASRITIFFPGIFFPLRI